MSFILYLDDREERVIKEAIEEQERILQATLEMEAERERRKKIADKRVREEQVNFYCLHYLEHVY